MNFGFCIFTTDYSISPAEVARGAEDRGFETLLFSEHTHIPSSRASINPLYGKDIPREYLHNYDPFVAMGAAAAVTKKIKLGTGICLVGERDPIILAKEVATVDHMSNGRVLLGVGGGWNREEMENHGTKWSLRWKVLRERIEAMKEIWTKEKATYHGEFVNFDEIWSWPKPVQKPHPPVLVGGDGERTFERVLRYGDGWMPHPRFGGFYADKIKRLNDMASQRGRSAVPITFFGAPSDPVQIEGFIRDGASRILFWLPSGKTDEVLAEMDRVADVVKRFQ
ncbi:MAG: LLM class F420-dependent oxidoreductase [Candidatus Tectomicrobia bacterium]|nr:LLM class F420-dependent oxidoreductase [Candidatus Tectomicrobia bacterium]